MDYVWCPSIFHHQFSVSNLLTICSEWYLGDLNLSLAHTILEKSTIIDKDLEGQYLPCDIL